MNNKEPLYYIITKIHNSNINSRSFLGCKWMFYQNCKGGEINTIESKLEEIGNCHVAMMHTNIPVSHV